MSSVGQQIATLNQERDRLNAAWSRVEDKIRALTLHSGIEVNCGEHNGSHVSLWYTKIGTAWRIGVVVGESEIKPISDAKTSLKIWLVGFAAKLIEEAERAIVSDTDEVYHAANHLESILK